ncbi:MAG: response regulator transcription factor [Sporomusaceae bacterium]|nr:response regulator transcription factor [Sporomusaceae bacterium]
MAANPTQLTDSRILIVDDHPLLREGLHRTLSDAGVSAVREAADGSQALAMLEAFRPDIVLMDLYMPAMSGIEATVLIKAKLPSARIVILSVCEDDNAVADALQAGAQGYLHKNMHSHEIISALRQLLLDAIPLAKPMNKAVLERLTETGVRKALPPGDKADLLLTLRECEVLAEMAAGFSNREIARKLYISENTAKNHVRSILGKLEVTSRTQAIARAAAAGIIRLQPDREQRAVF